VELSAGEQHGDGHVPSVGHGFGGVIGGLAPSCAITPSQDVIAKMAASRMVGPFFTGFFSLF
jgi:hypothetical protein